LRRTLHDWANSPGNEFHDECCVSRQIRVRCAGVTCNVLVLSAQLVYRFMGRRP
jgi:hypothetical protein